MLQSVVVSQNSSFHWKLRAISLWSTASSQGGGADFFSLVTAAGPEGTAWSCFRGGSDWVLGKGFHQRVAGPWHRCLRALGTAPGWWSSRSIWITLSGIWSEFWVILRGACSWTWWSLWVTYNSGYSLMTALWTKAEVKMSDLKRFVHERLCVKSFQMDLISHIIIYAAC